MKPRALPPTPTPTPAGTGRPPAPWVAVRTPSGRLVGYLDPSRLVLDVKTRSDQPVERIDLRALLTDP